jgi:hypothetical protein|tara:strand:+ start:1208 stop:1717 length:510 start_codon:yes stop_codon:yes gene_type:complete
MSYKEIKGYCKSCKKELYGRKRLYCDVECRNAVFYPLYAYDNHGRTCAHCGDLFIGKENFCSTDCKKLFTYENNKNHFYNPINDASGNQNSVNITTLPNNVASIVDTLPDTPRIVEDIRELNMIIATELPKARYANGKRYQRGIFINGKRKESMVVDEEESTSDTFTKN